MKVVAALLLLGALAPMQCQSDPPSEQRRYEQPPEALYALAGRLREAGETRAWRITLETILDRYPNSREAVMAKDDLERTEPAVAEPSAEGAPPP